MRVAPTQELLLHMKEVVRATSAVLAVTPASALVPEVPVPEAVAVAAVAEDKH